MDNSVPQHKPFLKFILIAAAALSAVVLALCAYAVHVFEGWDYYTSALGFMIFCCIWTWLLTAAFFLVPRLAPQFYFKWVFLGVMSLTAFFWLVSWALLAARVAATKIWLSPSFGLRKRSPDPKGKSSSSSFSSDSDVNDIINSALSSIGGSGSSFSTINEEAKKANTAWKISAAAAGVGALIWILVIVTTVFYGIACYQHYRANSTSGGLEGGEPKPMPPAAPTEMNNYGAPPSTTPNPDQQFAQQQPAYQQQQPYQPEYNQYQQPQQSQHVPM